MKGQRLYILLLFLLCLPFGGSTQTIMNGTVSFVTKENIYVRFTSTTTISIGDTLYSNNIPCLKVVKKSSTSCICQNINQCDVSKDNLLTHKGIVKKETEEVILDTIEGKPAISEEENLNQGEEKEGASQFKQSIRARSSIATYSLLSPFENGDRHRLVGRLSMNLQNVNDSKLSVESYLNYRENLNHQNGSLTTNAPLFRVFNMALVYDVDSSLQITGGRKINKNLSSIGAIDGIQVEKRIKTFISGAVLGFRPDIQDFDFNPNLFEYGAFIGNQISKRSIYSRFTLGFLEQRNSGKIDRRYLHLQSVQTINSKLNIFTSMEVDLYHHLENVSSFRPRLTNLFVSGNYRFNRKISVSLSYDNRKRIIFFETFRTQVEDLLSDDIARQGLRLRLNIRPVNRIFAGVSLAKRFQSNTENQSDNMNAFVTLNQFLLQQGNLSFRYNRNTSLYLSSTIYSSSYSFSNFKNRLNTQLYFRNVQYDYLNSENSSMQNYYGVNFYFRLSRSLRFGMLLEASERQSNRYYRFNTKLIKRFSRK